MKIPDDVLDEARVKFQYESWSLSDDEMRRLVSFVVENTIDYEAAEDTYLGFIDETERSRLHADDFDEARRQARVVVRAAIGNESDRQGSGGDDEAGSIPSVKGWEPAVTPSTDRRHR